MKVRPGTVAGTVAAPTSKSVTHRAYLLAAQSDVPCLVRSPLRGDDTHATLACLFAMNARFEAGTHDTRFLPAVLAPSRRVLDCANSGTTLRLLTAANARFGQPVVLDGDMSLRARPSTALLGALEHLGVAVTSNEGRAPLRVHGPLRSGNVELPNDVSSQFASALLLSLAMVDGPSQVTLRRPAASRPYIDLTLAMMRHFRLEASVDEAPDAVMLRTPGGMTPRANVVDVPGDWSGAAFLFGAAAVGRGRVAVTGLDGDPQGDRAILDHLRAFGCTVEEMDERVVVSGGGLASPGTIDVTATPDLFPILAVVAAAARGTTTLVGSRQLRVKESDRIATVAQGLRAIGVQVDELPQGLRIQGGSMRGGKVATRGDHRIHMAFAVAGLGSAQGVEVDEDACVRVSYPTFHADLRRLGATVLETIPT